MFGVIGRCWVAAHMCVLSHLRTCDVRAEVRAKGGLEMCVRCACARPLMSVQCAMALLHSFFQVNDNIPCFILSSAV